MSTPVTYLDSPALRKEVLEGIEELAGFVGITLGPNGRPVLLEQPDGRSPLSTKDGVTCSRHFIGSTPVKRVVADSAREACERTARLAGDGTTTAIVLAAALVKEGQVYLAKNKNLSPQQLARQLRDTFHNKVKPNLMALARNIKGLPKDQALAAITHVAKVSANHDIEIANAVAKASNMVGEDGMIRAEEGAGSNTDVVLTEGFPATTGLKDLGGSASTAFVNGTAGDCRVTGAYVLLYDGNIREPEQLLPIMQMVNSEVDGKGAPLRTPLVIFAHGFSDNVLRSLSTNFRRGNFTALPIPTPSIGQAHSKQAFLHDLAAYVGAVVLDSQGTGLQDATLSHLGFATAVKAGVSDTVIEAEFGEEETARVQDRIKDLKGQSDASGNDFDKDRFRYRISQLTGGVATILAGGPTAFEAKERHARVVDAISAVRSAMEMGVVPGGGSALLFVSGSLSESGPEGIIKRALRVPFVQILRNAGAIDVDENNQESIAVAGDIGPVEVDQLKGWMVFDVLESKYVDWWCAGIMDPVKVTLTALENALSVAQLLMTLGGVVAMSSTEDEKKIKQMQEAMMRAMNKETE